jgi:NADP-dependent 3-hydroxy acid dehydrogenase YdfG
MASNIKERQPVALITGAGGGIGTAIVMKITGQGFRVALADINKSNLDHLRQAVGSEYFSYHIDLTDPTAVKEMIDDLTAKTGRIDLLVNNAGMVIFKPFVICNVEELCQENAVNYLSALYCIKAVLPLMIKAGRGSIIAVSSLGALLPMATSPNYTASKAALRGLMLSLNLTLSRTWRSRRLRLPLSCRYKDAAW